jgi:hypothetical protein
MKIDDKIYFIYNNKIESGVITKIEAVTVKDGDKINCWEKYTTNFFGDDYFCQVFAERAFKSIKDLLIDLQTDYEKRKNTEFCFWGADV